MEEIYCRKKDENEIDYIIRLFKNKKEYDLDYVELFKLAFGVELATDECRKRGYGISMLIEKLEKYNLEKTPNDIQNEIKQTIYELKKERIKLNDERISINKILRNNARYESISEIALNCVKEIENKNDIFSSKRNISFGDKSLIVTLADFHYGLVNDEIGNIYNSDIFVERFNKYKDKIIELLNTNSIEKVYILGLGDFVSGLIHNVLRIENRENVVQQILNVSEYVCQFINEIGKYCNIEYRDVIGNHSRMIADKKENIDKESFDLLIHQFIKERFRNCDNIEIIENDINEKIGTLSIYNRNYAYMHGDNFNFNTVVQDVSLMTNKFYDAIFMGHLHHQMSDEQQRCYVYVSGTLSGTDSYAAKLRKFSNPSQNIFLVNQQEGIECQYIVKL